MSFSFVNSSANTSTNTAATNTNQSTRAFQPNSRNTTNNNTSSFSFGNGLRNTNTPTTAAIGSLDATDNKQEFEEKKSQTTNTAITPHINDFNISDTENRNIHITNPLSLQHTHLIISDGIIPQCSSMIHWNISRTSVTQSRQNMSSLKVPKKVIIPPSNRAFLLYFDPGSTRPNNGFNNNNNRRYTTVTVQEIQTKNTNSFGFGAPYNGTFTVTLQIFDPQRQTQSLFGNNNNTNRNGNTDINNAQNWVVHNGTAAATGFNNGISTNKRINLFEMNTLDSKIYDGMFRMKIKIDIPPTPLTKIIRAPENITPSKYLKFRGQYHGSANDSTTDSSQTQILGVTSNQNYNSSYSWYNSMNSMLEQQTFGDIEIQCSDGKYWRAHKDILSNFSPVFKAMLDNPMQESLENKIELKEEDSETMKYLLMFMYTGSIPNDIDLDSIGATLLKASDKFGVNGLSMLLFDFIKTRITPENVALALILCKLYKGSECRAAVIKLNKYVLRYLSEVKNMRKVLRSKSFEVLFTQYPGLVKTVLLATNSINASKNSKGNNDQSEDIGDEILYFDEDSQEEEDD